MDEQLIMEARSNKRTKKSVVVAKTVVELDVEEEHIFSLRERNYQLKELLQTCQSNNFYISEEDQREEENC